MEFLFSLTLGSILFWGISFIIVLLMLEQELYGAILFLLLMSFVGYCYHYSLNPYNWFIHNWATILLYMTGYLIAGIIWSFYRFHVQIRKDIKVFKYDSNFKPSIEPYYWKISNYIMYWPISIICYVLSDLIKNLCDYIIKYFKGFYQSIIDYNIKNRG